MRLFTFLLFVSTMLRGQEGDSLVQSALSIGSDTERVNQLYRHGFSLRQKDPQLAFKLARLCEQNALNCGSKRHLAKSYNLSGVLHYRKGDLTRAAAYHKQALKLRESAGDLLGIAMSQTNLGNIYVDLKLFQKAESCHRAALEIYRRLGDQTREANCLINLGALKQHQDEQDAASEFYAQALKLGEKLNDYDIRSICLNNMAVVFYKKGKYERAIGYNQDALKLRNLMDNNVEAADSYLNLAANYIQLDNFDRAIRDLDQAYEIAKRYDYFEAMQEAQKIYADYYEAIGDYEAAYEYLRDYYRVRDSALAVQNTELQLSELSETENSGESQVGLHNDSLLIVVLLLAVFIPFYFIRFKR